MIRVEDNEQQPIAGFPLQVELGEGIDYMNNETALPVPGGGKTVRLGNKSYRLVSGPDGCASINYRFSNRQPSQFALLLGAPTLPERSIELTPLQSLPKGSKVKLSIPNP